MVLCWICHNMRDLLSCHVLRIDIFTSPETFELIWGHRKASQGSTTPSLFNFVKNQYQRMIFRRILSLSAPPCAGLVHCDICLGNLPPQPLHSFPVAKGRPLSNGRFRYGQKFLFTIIWNLVKFPALYCKDNAVLALHCIFYIWKKSIQLNIRSCYKICPFVWDLNIFHIVLISCVLRGGLCDLSCPHSNSSGLAFLFPIFFKRIYIKFILRNLCELRLNQQLLTGIYMWQWKLGVGVVLFCDFKFF